MAEWVSRRDLCLGRRMTMQTRWSSLVEIACFDIQRVDAKLNRQIFTTSPDLQYILSPAMSSSSETSRRFCFPQGSRRATKPMSTDFCAGYLSGAIGIVIGNPLDLIKVRLQAGQSSIGIAPGDFKNQFETTSSLVRGEHCIVPWPAWSYLYLPFRRSGSGIGIWCT